LQAESLLGSLLLIEKKYDEAEASLLRAYEGLKRHEADAPSRSRSRIMQETVDRMVQLYEARGQAGKAAEWRQKLR
jgi:hypothetical protein